ncbi:MAG: UvrD-helicase domain-containing protein, partial [Desulfobacterota bacterium]|nr:UvrD-helicase domain-containing protein [Thermodesulfobacteriota bacterium]
RLSALDGYLLVSNSDAHSPEKLGREANLFDTSLDYDSLVKAMTENKGFEGTIEFFPEEGKYHHDGHRKCGVSLHPSETRRLNGVCPKCGKPVTVGVLHRVYELADRETPTLPKPFFSIIPLPEILSEILGCGPSAKKVTAAYEELLARFGSELHILMDAPSSDIERAGGRLLAEAIDRMRESRVIREEGYDGEYGVIRLFEEAEKATFRGQTALFDAPAGERVEKPEAASLFSSLPDRAVHEEPEPYQTFLFDPILDPLNPAQKEAVLHQGSHLLIVAGPGTGKTMTIMHRIAYQIRSQLATAGEILSLTFTNKAAAEMRKRLTALLPDEHGAQVKVSTFHAFCLEVLREKGALLGLRPDFGLVSENDAVALARQVLSEWVPPGGARAPIPSESPRPEAEGRVEGSKKGVRSAARFLRDLPGLKLASLEEGRERAPLFDLYEKYQQKLSAMGMLDLDDLEVETLRLFRNHPGIAEEIGKRFPKVFVDEYQDTNPTQVEILKRMVSSATDLPWTVDRGPCTVHICAIGDPDQAIYGFRGADAENFSRFPDDFPGAKTVTLLVNYRSTQPILDAAASVMQKKQKLKSAVGIGERVQVSDCRTEAEEAEMIVEQIEKLIGGTSYFSLDSGRASSQDEHANLGFGDMAVLFRLNAQGDAFEEAFSRAGIPFVRSGEKPLIESFPVNILWRFLQTIVYPENSYYQDAYRRIVKDHGLTPLPPVLSWPSGDSSATTRASVLLSFRPKGEILESLHTQNQDFSPSSLSGTRKDMARQNHAGEDRLKLSSSLVARTNSSVRGGLGRGEREEEGSLTDLMNQAVALHGLTSLSEEEGNRLRRLNDLARGCRGDLKSFLDALSLERGIDHAGLLGDRVALMSLHAAKGLEWPVVFLAGCEDQLLPCKLFGDQDDAEEKRLFYVGMTRARSRLILSHAARRTLNRRPLDMKPSPFTLLIPQNLRRPLERKPWKPKKKAPNQLSFF